MYLTAGLLERGLPAEEADDLVRRLGGCGNQRQRRRGVPRRQTGNAGDLAPGHRTRDVEREQQPLTGRLDVLERGVERRVERIDDLPDRVPLASAPSTATGAIDAKRRQQPDRVDPSLSDPL